MQTQGYMIVLEPKVLIEMYDQFLVGQNAEDYLCEFREAFRAFNPKRYRGIFRECLFAYPSLSSQEIENFQAKCNMFFVPFGKTDELARYRFREIIGKPVDEYSPLSDRSYDVLDSLADAKELYFLLDDPKQWEIIHVSREESLGSKSTLGFDIGYWDLNHFSLIGDTIVTPRFHPPPREDYANLSRAFSKLNEHLLFTSINDAESFRS